MGDHSYEGEEYPPGTVFGPDGQPYGPASDTGLADEYGPADQELDYEESEDLEPDVSKADPAVEAAR